MKKLFETTTCKQCGKKAIRLSIPPLNRKDFTVSTMWWCACGSRIPAEETKIPVKMRPPMNCMTVFDLSPNEEAIRDMWEILQIKLGKEAVEKRITIRMVQNYVCFMGKARTT